MNFKTFKNHYEKIEVKENNNIVPNQVLISICIVTYNHKNYISKCLNSILMQQTNFNFEILLGEDASTDGTREICIEYAKKYPGKIRLFLHHRENNININGSPTGRFNFLYNLYTTKGKYIALCEGDDYWTDPYKLQKQVAILEDHANVSLVYSNAKIVSDNKGDYVDNDFFYSENYPSTPIKNQAFFLKNNFALLSVSIMFRKEFLGAKELELMRKFAVGDLPLHFIFSGKGDFYYINEPMVVYNDHGQGISKTFGKLNRNLLNYKQMDWLLPYIKNENIKWFNYFCHTYLIKPIFNAFFNEVIRNKNKKISIKQFMFIKSKHLKLRYCYYIVKLIVYKLKP